MMNIFLLTFMFVLGVSGNPSVYQQECEYKGKRYKFGESFHEGKCDYLCHCRKGTDTYMAELTCQRICTPSQDQADPKCTKQETLSIVNVTSSIDRECSCPTKRCVPGYCEGDGKKKYKVGENYILQPCNAKCQCKGHKYGLCIDYCPPQRKCAPDEIKEEKWGPLDSNNCKCKETKCNKLSFLICNGKDDGCCTKNTPCFKGDGDCDVHADCLPGLKCGYNNCPWGDEDDCCTDEIMRCKGADDYCCTPWTPCDLGDGDCDRDSDCAEGLVCGKDNCPWGDKDDCCMKP